MTSFSHKIITMVLGAVLLSGLALGTMGCKDSSSTSGNHKTTEGSRNQTGVTDTESSKQVIPSCNADSALAFAQAQVDFGPRIPNSKAQEQCAEYLAKTLRKYGATVQIQEFDAVRWDKETLKGYNIIASIQPQNPQRVLLCAHWDSRPYADNEKDENLHHQPIDGANDGASGTAVLLEIARVMQGQKPDVGIDIILFDLEDSGKPQWEPNAYGDEYTWGLGSQYWSNTPHVPGYRAHYGILLDMVGSPEPTFCMEATSMYYAPDIMQKVWDKAASMGYGHIFQNRATGAIIDDHLFINHITGIPTIDIIHYDMQSPTGFFPHWHTVNDNMQNISGQSLKIVGDVVLSMIFEN